MKVGDGPGVGIVACLVGEPALAIGYSFAVLAGQPEVAGRPRLDQHLVELLDASLAACLPEGRVGFGDAAAFGELVDDDARLDAGNVLPAHEPAVAEIDQPGEGAVRRGLVAAHEGAPPFGIARLQPFLVFLVERDRFEPCAADRDRLRP